MTVPARLLGFAAVLALVFATAAFAGRRLDLGAGSGPAADGHGGMAAMDPQGVRGLAVSERGLGLELATRSARRGERRPLAFRIADARGRTVRGFDVEHTKRMHLVVVRRDLRGFQHLHPAQRADGSWSVPLTLPAAGTYRVLADFVVAGRPHTLADDLVVDGSARSAALPPPVPAVTVDGLRVALTAGAARAGVESGLAFTVTRDGAPVALRDHLGAKGHLVALRRGDLAFLHVHPDADRLRFEATFPTTGRYRLFLQFRTADGRLHTAAFTRDVAR